MSYRAVNKKYKRKTNRQNLISRLDKEFSLYIRLRDSDSNGICRCITSGEFLHYTKCDAGHFITRNNMATRWDERNVNAQNRQDNRFLSGRQYEHGLAIDRKFGKGTAELLLYKSKKAKHWFDFELIAMIKDYTQKVKELKEAKGML